MPGRARAGLGAGVLLAVLLCATAVAAPGPLADAAFLAVLVLSLAAVVVGVRRHRPVRPLGWWLVGAGLLAWGTGDVVYAVLTALGRDPFPSLADAAYLVAYPLLAGGLFHHLRERAQRARSGLLLDVAVVVCALWLVLWVGVVEPVLAAPPAGVLAQVVGAAYPLGDVLLAGLLVPHLALPGGRGASARLLGAALVAMLAADVLYVHLEVVLGVDPGPVDVLYLVSYLLLGASAVHPSMRWAGAAPVEAPGGRGLTRSGRTALAAAVLVAPGVLTVQLLRGVDVSGWPVVLGTVVVLLLVVARMDAAVRAVARASHERELLQARVAHRPRTTR